MNILLVSSLFPPLKGGVEKVVESLARHLSEKDRVVVVTSLDLNRLIGIYSKSAGKLARSIQKIRLGFRVSDEENSTDGYEIKRFWMNLPRSTLGFFSFPYRFIATVVALINYAKQKKPDIVNYHFPDDSSIYMWIVGRFVNVPMVVNVHGNDLHVFSQKYPYSFFVKRIFNEAEVIVVNSDYMRSEFLKSFSRYEKKIQIIPNGIDIKYFQNIKPQKFFDKPYIFFVGRMVHKKGVDILLKAFSDAHLNDVKLLLEGKGEKLEEMKMLADRLGVNKDVTFTEGKLTDDEKVAYMKGSIFCVIPSRIEPFGIVALEMMASGCPMIASKTGGLAKIVKDGKNGVFFENENVEDLSKKMKEMYKDVELRKRLSKNAKASVEKYDEKEVALKYIKLFKEVVE